MSNEKYINALRRRVSIFKKDFIEFSREQFTDQGGLIHPGEFGASREIICKRLFEDTIPISRNIDTRGFIINANNQISGEEDIIFYSKENTPVLTLEGTKFFPVETVVSVGQVKTIIRSKEELRDALLKLTNIKKLRDNMGHHSVIWRGQDLFDGRNSYDINNPYDQIFTFLICEKIDFQISPLDINSLYDSGTPDYYKHNLILDLSRGIYGYQLKEGDPFVGAPLMNGVKGSPMFIPQIIENEHIIHFLTNLQIFIPGGTVFHPDMGMYIK